MALVCADCQHRRELAANLPGFKFGAVRRALLLTAGEPGSRGRPALPSAFGVEGQTAMRRALSDLSRAGLVELTMRDFTAVGVEEVRIATQKLVGTGLVAADDHRLAYALMQRKGKLKAKVRLRLYRRTLLGEAVVGAFAEELKTGRPRRWAGRLERALDDCERRCEHRHMVEADHQSAREVDTPDST